MREFHIGDILSITTGKLLSPTGIGGIYEILNYMSGDNLFTHQLPRVAKECEPFLLEQYPQLKEVDTEGVNPENWRAWLQAQAERFGERLPVTPLPKGRHQWIDPIAEAVDLVGDESKVTVVKVGGDPPAGS